MSNGNNDGYTKIVNAIEGQDQQEDLVRRAGYESDQPGEARGARCEETCQSSPEGAFSLKCDASGVAQGLTKEEPILQVNEHNSVIACRKHPDTDSLLPVIMYKTNAPSVVQFES